jgi:hypothetical protein
MIRKNSNLLSNIVLSALKYLRIEKKFEVATVFESKDMVFFMFEHSDLKKTKQKIEFKIHFRDSNFNYGEIWAGGSMICGFDIESDYSETEDIGCIFPRFYDDVENVLIHFITELL